MDWQYSLSGLLVGSIVGLTGVGGGSLMTPLLVMLFGIAPAVAVGTDLLYAGITKAGGSVAHSRHGSVQWRVAGLLALGSIPTAAITTLLLKSLSGDANTVAMLVRVGLGVALILSAAALFYKEKLQKLAERGRNSGQHGHCYADGLTVLAGAVLGGLVTLTSVGAGALGAVVLTWLYPKLTTTQVVGTDIVHAVPLTLVAGMGHVMIGTVNYVLLLSLLAGSLPGIWIGSRFCARLPERQVRAALSLVLLVVGGKLVI
jgi:uncharacterized membrane protein YfcA